MINKENKTFILSNYIYADIKYIKMYIFINNLHKTNRLRAELFLLYILKLCEDFLENFVAI